MATDEKLVLWVRAGADGARLGGDPLCQQMFMILLLKAEKTDIKMDVKAVNEAKPPAEFRSAGLRHAPALQHGDDIAISHPDEILEYIDRTFPFPSLKYSNADADNQTADLFRAFCFFIKEVNKDPKGLETELIRLDRFLGEIETAFLTGNSPSHLDCSILPKLHSIRIGARALKEFEIPIDLHHLWQYLKRGYELDAFRKSVPSDQEIVLHWADRPDTKKTISVQERAKLCRQKTETTLTIPVLDENNK